MPSNITNNIPADIPFWNGPDDAIRKGTGLAIESGENFPRTTATAKDSGSESETGSVGSLERVLVVGIVISVAVVGLSAWL